MHTHTVCTYVHYSHCFNVCVYCSGSYTYSGTGFIGEIKIDGNSSKVLVTNYHVMIGGLPEDTYKKAIKVTSDMQKAIEGNARKSQITLIKENNKQTKLSGETLVPNSSIMSPRTSVCYYVHM